LLVAVVLEVQEDEINLAVQEAEVEVVVFVCFKVQSH
jgi:hypothetical protein